MRALRELQDGAIYHVTSEINRNEMDLQADEIKTMFLTFIKKAKAKYPFQLLNFCIMDNHIHLLIKPEQGQCLSDIMKWLKGNFARYWNKVHNKKSGHLWGKRFFSKIINSIVQFSRVLDYIDKNPQKARLVKQAGNWEYGGLYHDLHGRTDVVDIPRKGILKIFLQSRRVAVPAPQSAML